MMRCGVVYFLLGPLCLGLATSSKSAIAAQKPSAPTTATRETTARGQSNDSGIANVSGNKPLITIAGLCDDRSADKGPASNCKTVITQAQFEKMMDAVQPDMPARARREFALRYAEALVMTKKAEQMGLDKGAKYEAQMRLARIEVLSQELKKMIQGKVSQISDKDIEDYYHNNTATFERADMERIYVPKIQQPPSASDKKPSDDDQQKRPQDDANTMKEEAENLHARAVAGEEFTKLQADAYQVAGIKSAAPNTNMRVTRISLPPNQVSVMDLNSGEVSSVFVDPNAYVFYKVKNKDVIPLDQAREEIRGSLRSQRMQDEMSGILDSATATLDESYFERVRPPQDNLGVGKPIKPPSKADSGKPDSHDKTF